jgi:hypothetical protein
LPQQAAASLQSGWAMQKIEMLRPMGVEVGLKSMVVVAVKTILEMKRNERLVIVRIMI